MSDSSVESLPVHETALPTSSSSSIANWNVLPNHQYQHHDKSRAQQATRGSYSQTSHAAPAAMVDDVSRQLYDAHQHQAPTSVRSPEHRRSRRDNDQLLGLQLHQEGRQLSACYEVTLQSSRGCWSKCSAPLVLRV